MFTGVLLLWTQYAIHYTVLNEKDAAMNEKGNYVLAIIKTKESYDNVKESLVDLINEMSNLKEITANNVKYNIEYFLERGLAFAV